MSNLVHTLQIELERTPPPCDRCRHPSLVYVILAELRLSLCGHHFEANEPLLAIAGWRVGADTRAMLAARGRRLPGGPR